MSKEGNTIHCFNVEDAKEHGVLAAVILYNIKFWLDKNLANKKHIYDGRVWTYNSISAFNELFPYATPSQIRYALETLKKKNIIISGNYNKAPYDRTLWYSVNENGYATIHKSICDHSQMDVLDLTNGIETIHKPIPDINTNINTNEKRSNINTDQDPKKYSSFRDAFNAGLTYKEYANQ